MNAREGFYEKLWKEFVSLQLGDVKKICDEAELFRRLQPAYAECERSLEQIYEESGRDNGCSAGCKNTAKEAIAVLRKARE